MSDDFVAQVDAWIMKTQERQEAVFRAALQRLVTLMQTPVGEGGNMPVVTGALRASLTASTAGPPPVRAFALDGAASVSYTPDQVTLTIAQATMHDTVWLVYTVAYARQVEYGYGNSTPRAFVRSAAQQWQSIVDDVADEVRRRIS